MSDQTHLPKLIRARLSWTTLSLIGGRHLRRNRGFALIVTLSLMILLTIIAVEGWEVGHGAAVEI